MEIIPASEITIMKGIEWDSSYVHIRKFNSRSQQITYMASKAYQVISDATYVRKTRAIAVPGQADLYENCNYCSFLNTGFGTRTFYAFITGVEYVNPGCTYLYIEVDVVQTWLFDFEVGKCFVEREHVADDTIGKHTVPENIPYGDMIVAAQVSYAATPTATVGYAANVSKVNFQSGIYNPLTYQSGTTGSDIAAALNSLADTPERIALLKMGFGEFTTDLAIQRDPGAFTYITDSYTPVNKKLYCYPYCSLVLDDFGSNIEGFKWEDFAAPTVARFLLMGVNEPYPISTATPRNYKNTTLASQFRVVKTDFPDCPYVIDNFRAWLSSVGAKQQLSEENAIAQTVYADVGSVVGALTGIASSAASGNIGGGASAGIGAALGTMARHANLETARASNAIDREYAKTHSASVGGQFGGNVANWIQGDRGWRLTSYTIKPEYARIIDGFFTRFGYKVNAYKVPELNSRTTFNYVKTVDADVAGDIPNDAAAMLESIFNRGVTIWHVNDIANFSLKNEVKA